MTFAQRRNRITTHFSERIPVVKRRISVFLKVCMHSVNGDINNIYNCTYGVTKTILMLEITILMLEITILMLEITILMLEITILMLEINCREQNFCLILIYKKI